MIEVCMADNVYDEGVSERGLSSQVFFHGSYSVDNLLYKYRNNHEAEWNIHIICRQIKQFNQYDEKKLEEMHNSV